MPLKVSPPLEENAGPGGSQQLGSDSLICFFSKRFSAENLAGKHFSQLIRHIFLKDQLFCILIPKLHDFVPWAPSVLVQIMNKWPDVYTREQVPQEQHYIQEGALVIVKLSKRQVSDVAFNASGSGWSNFNHTVRDSEFS